MNRRTMWASGAAALIALAACGGSDDTVTPATVLDAVTRPTTATNDPGERYLQLIEPANCAIAIFAGEASTDPTWWETRDEAAIVASTQVELAANLETEQWPEDAQYAIDLLVDSTNQRAGQWQALADADSVSEAQAAGDELTSNTPGVGLSSTVRYELDLPDTGEEPSCPGNGG